MNKAAIWRLIFLLVSGTAFSAHAVELARWNSTVTNQMAGNFAPTSQHVNVAVSNLMASTNLLLSGGGAAANVFAAAGYTAASSNAAMTAGHYWQTVLQANAGYSLSFDNVAYRFRRANSGPQWAQWAYSTDGVNFIWLDPAGSNTTAYSEKTVSLSAIPALQSATGKIWFRMYAWLGGTANTAWGAYGQAADVLIFSGTVGTAGPVVPTVAFNPSGAQSVAASNELTLAVSITPAGSGMKSWTFLPSNYAGTASMSGGTFHFTPAGSDTGKILVLSVVGSNSVGNTTGTVSVTVTAYMPPVPIIAFSPAAPYSIMATYTQKLGIGVSPAGSGIQSWTLLPSNYAGSATLVGTNFTFTTLAADGPSNYTFTVIATNVFGATTGTAEIAVSAYVSPPPASAYICTFEDGSKTGYASGDVTLSNKVWNLTGILIGTDANDLKIGAKAARLKHDTSDGDETMTIQSTVMSNGVSTVALWYGPYGTHGTNAPTLAVEISEDLLTGWVEVGEVVVGAVSVLTYQSIDVYVSSPIYVRIRAKSGNNDKSANFDNITITPYAAQAQTPYNAFLLKYNVTPGDPGTGPNDDLDDDGITNTNEFLVDSNPYVAP